MKLQVICRAAALHQHDGAAVADIVITDYYISRASRLLRCYSMPGIGGRTRRPRHAPLAPTADRAVPRIRVRRRPL